MIVWTGKLWCTSELGCVGSQESFRQALFPRVLSLCQVNEDTGCVTAACGSGSLGGGSQGGSSGCWQDYDNLEEGSSAQRSGCWAERRFQVPARALVGVFSASVGQPP